MTIPYTDQLLYVRLALAKRRKLKPKTEDERQNNDDNILMLEAIEISLQTLHDVEQAEQQFSHSHGEREVKTMSASPH